MRAAKERRKREYACPRSTLSSVAPSLDRPPAYPPRRESSGNSMYMRQEAGWPANEHG